jgi:MerR family transcriptional regulator, repressor of the yfmOP operon
VTAPSGALAAPGTGRRSGQSSGRNAEHPARDELLSIGAAATLAGVSERALRYYQELGLITPCARTPGGMRRYSEADLARVARIRELQTLLGLNLDEIAVVLHNDDRLAEIKAVYHDEHTGVEERAKLAGECLVLLEQLRQTVEAKRAALDTFLGDLDTRIARVQSVLPPQ